MPIFTNNPPVQLERDEGNGRKQKMLQDLGQFYKQSVFITTSKSKDGDNGGCRFKASSLMGDAKAKLNDLVSTAFTAA